MGYDYRKNYRSTYQDKKWKKKIHKRDNDTCVCCGDSNMEFKYAHHLYSFVDNEDLRHDVNNGVTLCKKCHLGFHRVYGNGYNTKEQFEEFLNNREAE